MMKMPTLIGTHSYFIMNIYITIWFSLILTISNVGAYFTFKTSMFLKALSLS